MIPDTVVESSTFPSWCSQYLIQCYLKIQQQARRHQAERELTQSTEHDPSQPPADDGETITVSPRSKTTFPTIHFVETASSVLRELPWILPKEYKVVQCTN